MDTIESMRRFTSVARLGSFTKAAEELNVPKSAISKSISRLEEHLKTRLFLRSTRRISLTESGERYLSECLRLLIELDALESEFQSQSEGLNGVIRVDMPSRFFTSFVAPQLSQWFSMHPNTKIDVLGADRRINPIEEQVDCVVRGGILNDSSLIARRLGEMAMINCVSPSYVQRYGLPEHVSTLSEHFVVGYCPDGRRISSEFEYIDGDGERRLFVNHRVSVATTEAYLTAGLNGLGIIQLPRYGVESYLESGELLEVLKPWTCQAMPISIMYESRRQQPKRVRTFIEWLATLFEESTGTQNQS